MTLQDVGDALQRILQTWAQANGVRLWFGDLEDRRPRRDHVRPTLNPAPLLPGPSVSGRLQATERGLYTVDLYSRFKPGGQNEVLGLGQELGEAFYPPEGGTVRLVENTTTVIIDRRCDVLRRPTEDGFNSAQIDVHWIVYS